MRHLHETHRARTAHRPPRPHRVRRALGLRTALPAALAAVAAVALTALPPPAAAAADRAPRLGECAAGQLCLWERTDFRGPRHTRELADTDIESCVPLPGGTGAASLANRTGRPVTAYQSAECAETGEFDTYPSGSWAPQAGHRVRAIKIWES
ncbi:peptidase inhibitor family I36 protein [Streptomyces desertarenae]|uniref:Peptidase inhibitor family I36 protein n=1 Tax=Streptomyces desertarenae TaxID=2666184 RepID=A0ABW4PDW6_9ACTN